MLVSCRRGLCCSQTTPHTERHIPTVVIQGDVLPVIKYFQFAGRLHRLDMNQPLECIRTAVSRHLPRALFLYLPRVANSIVDDLAGQASQFVLAKYRRDPTNFNRDSGPVSMRPAFPAALFQAGGFHIQCFEQPWVHPVLTLVERPFIDHGLLRRHLTLHPHHRQLIESYLPPCLPQCSSIEIGYSPGHWTIRGESIVAQWADKECRGQPDSFSLGEATVKLTLKDPFMS